MLLFINLKFHVGWFQKKIARLWYRGKAGEGRCKVHLQFTFIHHLPRDRELRDFGAASPSKRKLLRLQCGMYLSVWFNCCFTLFLTSLAVPGNTNRKRKDWIAYKIPLPAALMYFMALTSISTPIIYSHFLNHEGHCFIINFPLSFSLVWIGFLFRLLKILMRARIRGNKISIINVYNEPMFSIEIEFVVVLRSLL